MTDDQAKQVAQLRSEIAALRTAIASLATLPILRRPLETQLAAKERELAALQGVAQPATRSHSQIIGGNAQVGTAIAGDVHGNITHQQSGGINLGTGNRIEQIGDVVAGDKHVTEGPRMSGSINAHRDVNIATNQTINNAATDDRPVDPSQPAESNPEHVQQLIELNTRRLRVLEVQSAHSGYNARPEVLTEIGDIRAEIARLQALLAT